MMATGFRFTAMALAHGRPPLSAPHFRVGLTGSVMPASAMTVSPSMTKAPTMGLGRASLAFAANPRRRAIQRSALIAFAPFVRSSRDPAIQTHPHYRFPSTHSQIVRKIPSHLLEFIEDHSAQLHCLTPPSANCVSAVPIDLRRPLNHRASQDATSQPKPGQYLVAIEGLSGPSLTTKGCLYSMRSIVVNRVRQADTRDGDGLGLRGSLLTRQSPCWH